jgi:hypothetical protein
MAEVSQISLMTKFRGFLMQRPSHRKNVLDDWLTKDKQKAAETIVSINAGKKLEKQRSGEI